METVHELAMAFIMLIRAGAGLRIIYCFILMGVDEEQQSSYQKRIKHAIIFYIMAECVWQIRDLVMAYYME